MAVNLQVSAEQAALLAPLLQQISSATLRSVSDENTLEATASVTTSPLPSSFHRAPDKSPRETPRGTTDCFCAVEMLARKKKNEKCSPAQTHLLVSDKWQS